MTWAPVASAPGGLATISTAPPATPRTAASSPVSADQRLQRSPISARARVCDIEARSSHPHPPIAPRPLQPVDLRNTFEGWGGGTDRQMSTHPAGNEKEFLRRPPGKN